MHKLLISIVLSCLFISCDLEEELFDRQTPSTFLDDEASFILASGRAYTSLYEYMATYSYFISQELTSDEMTMPARGGDWYDGGHWQRLHTHEYLPSDITIERTWNFCYRGVSTCNDVIDLMEENLNPNGEQYLAEIKILRALYYYWLLDLYGIVPIVESNDILNPINNSTQEVYDFIEKEILENQEKLSRLVNPGTYGRVTFYTAQAILASLYLNAETYTGTPQWDEAISACNEIIQSGLFDLTANYFDNFDTDNVNSSEMIFAIPYEGWDAPGFNLHMMTLHYNSFRTYNLAQQPWNGFCSLQEFYESYEDEDVRKGNLIAGYQFTIDGDTLKDFGAEDSDPDGPPINFTPEISTLDLFSIRQEGARIGKYEIEEGANQNLNNDMPIFRYGEILLNKAEALWRKDQGNVEALALVNLFRNRANVPEFTELNEGNLLAERGRELAFEAKRRTDLIRFGKYEDEWAFKDVSDPCKALFPIPQAQLNAGGNLNQNPCY